MTLLAIVISIFTLAACGGSHGASSKNPATLIGEWHQVDSDPNGWFTASISGESIQVNLHGRDSRSIFWMGSFDTSHRPIGKFKVVSLPDPDARYTMKRSLMASTDSKKTFSYNDGELSFKFSALGTTTIVHMHQTKAHIPTLTRTVSPKYKKPAAPKIAPRKPKIVSPPRVSIRKK